MIQALYDNLGIPDTCRLGKRVFKKLFEENATLGTSDRKALREDLDSVIWVYTLKPCTIRIQPYEDTERDYPEIAVLQADLRTTKGVDRLARIIHRAIPYPVILVFNHQAPVKHHQCLISLAHKRFSQAEKGAIVADDFVATGWIDLAEPSPLQQAFLASLRIADLPQVHFHAVYTAIADRIVALGCSDLSGEYRLEPDPGRRAQRRERLTACRALESRIGALKARIRKETQFNRQVELNTQIKQLEQQLLEDARRL
ncbi:DUF4391 domain-containing protein [Thiocapsa sp.]|uniref:DUF4391 domain-containing protein n=1 Tax=Thiocapsa sp. TaxID=2024551 RepID=UPI002C5FC82C|nr:DUF4391 domain-containing protein [Thiocapsa sp.]HSO82541.1 DUF4391 domain-containing protein [Thiocapsa sp.]